jgi:hypothetical protein
VQPRQNDANDASITELPRQRDKSLITTLVDLTTPSGILLTPACQRIKLTGVANLRRGTMG